MSVTGIRNHLSLFQKIPFSIRPKFQLMALLFLAKATESAAKSCYAPCRQNDSSSRYCYITCEKNDCDAEPYSSVYQQKELSTFAAEDAAWFHKSCDSVYLIANEVLNKTVETLSSRHTFLPEEQDEFYRALCETMRGNCEFSCERSEFVYPSSSSMLGISKSLLLFSTAAALYTLANQSRGRVSTLAGKILISAATVFVWSESLAPAKGLDVRCSRSCILFSRRTDYCSRECSDDNCEDVAKEDGEKDGKNRAFNERITHYENAWKNISSLVPSLTNGSEANQLLVRRLEVNDSWLTEIVEGAACGIYPKEGGTRPALCQKYPPPAISHAGRPSANGQLMLGALLLGALFKRVMG